MGKSKNTQREDSKGKKKKRRPHHNLNRGLEAETPAVLREGGKKRHQKLKGRSSMFPGTIQKGGSRGSRKREEVRSITSFPPRRTIKRTKKESEEIERRKKKRGKNGSPHTFSMGGPKADLLADLSTRNSLIKCPQSKENRKKSVAYEPKCVFVREEKRKGGIWTGS